MVLCHEEVSFRLVRAEISNVKGRDGKHGVPRYHNKHAASLRTERASPH